MTKQVEKGIPKWMLECDASEIRKTTDLLHQVVGNLGVLGGGGSQPMLDFRRRQAVVHSSLNTLATRAGCGRSTSHQYRGLGRPRLQF